MQVPQNLPHDVLQQDDRVEVGKIPILWTVVVLSPFCALFWMAVIWAVMKMFGG